MRATLIVLSLLAVMAVPAVAEDSSLIWKGSLPTGKAHIKDQFGERDILCYPTIRQYPGQPAQQVYRAIECTGDAAGLSDIGMPLNDPLVNMNGYHETRPENARVVNGKIILK